MKKIYLATVLFCTYFLAGAQIPNAGFESWNGNIPVGWTLDTLYSTTGVSPSADFYTGDSAVKLTASANTPQGVSIFVGTWGNYGFPDTVPPISLHGWYILNSVGGDLLNVTSHVKLNGNIIADEDTLEFATPTSVYKEFITNYVYDTIVHTLDTVTIILSLENDTANAHAGSYIIIDDLSLVPNGSAGITSITKDVAALETCMPNPATNRMDIIYNIARYSTVNVAIYDLLGRNIKTVLTDTNQSDGRYKIATDVNDLPNGIYFCQLSVNGQSYAQKVVVSK